MALKTITQMELRPVAKTEAMQLAVLRQGSGGLGSLIDSPESKGIIAGVQIAPFIIRPGDRGYFLEVFRFDQGIMQDFGPSQTLQVSAAFSHPETIKAIHYHLRQTDLWTPVMGLLKFLI